MTGPTGFEQDVLRSLGRIEGTLDALSLEQKTQNLRLGSVEQRVGDLEHIRSKQKGALAVISALVSATVALTVAVIRGIFS